MRCQSLLVARGEREEARVEGLIRSQPGVTRANTVWTISPKGGVGKTTSTLLVLSRQTRLSITQLGFAVTEQLV